VAQVLEISSPWLGEINKGGISGSREEVKTHLPKGAIGSDLADKGEGKKAEKITKVTSTMGTGSLGPVSSRDLLLETDLQDNTRGGGTDLRRNMGETQTRKAVKGENGRAGCLAPGIRKQGRDD